MSAQALEVGLDAPRVLMLELAERVAADTLLRATPGAPRRSGTGTWQYQCLFSLPCCYVPPRAQVETHGSDSGTCEACYGCLCATMAAFCRHSLLHTVCAGQAHQWEIFEKCCNG